MELAPNPSPYRRALRCFSEQQDFYILSRFTADLGQGLMLADAKILIRLNVRLPAYETPLLVHVQREAIRMASMR
jgi:hypothetical protein